MVRLGKQSLFPHSYRRIRPEVYKPLPEGWVWPPIPHQSDLPHPKRRRKKKRRIPQEVLDEWKNFSKSRIKPIVTTNTGIIPENSMPGNIYDPKFPEASNPPPAVSLDWLRGTQPLPSHTLSPHPETVLGLDGTEESHDPPDPKDLEEQSSDDDSAAGEVAFHDNMQDQDEEEREYLSTRRVL